MSSSLTGKPFGTEQNSWTKTVHRRQPSKVNTNCTAMGHKEEQFRMPGTLMTKVWHYYSYSQTKKSLAKLLIQVEGYAITPSLPEMPNHFSHRRKEYN